MRDQLADLPFKYPGHWLEDRLGANMEPREFDNLLGFIIGEQERAVREALQRLWDKTQPDVVPDGWEPDNCGKAIKEMLDQLSGGEK